MHPVNPEGKYWFVRLKPGQRFYVFLASVVVASGLWLLNALNKTYSETVDIQLKYINLPNKYAFSPRPTSQLQVELNADGFTILQFKNKSDNDTLEVDVSQLDFEERGKKQRAVLATKSLLRNYKAGLDNNVAITKVNLDTIFVFYEKSKRKEVRIQPNVQVNLAPGMVLKQPIKIQPEFINVVGPSADVQDLIQLYTQELILDEVSESGEYEVRLQYNPNIFTLEQPSVKVLVEVEVLTEGKIEVPIEMVNVPPRRRLRIIPNTVEIHYTTGLSHFDFISSDLFKLEVNFDDIENNPSKLPVYLKFSPAYVNVINFKPQRVDYLILEE